MNVPFQNFRRSAEAQIGRELLQAADRVLRSGHYVLGTEVASFESELARRLEIGFVVGVASGLDALTLGFRAVGIGPGDEVITTPFSAAATALAVTHAGATPVFVDVSPATLALNPDCVSRAITPRTRAVLAVHLYGVPADLAALQRLCRENDLMLLEDCAQAHLATYEGRPVGGFGRWSAFSFYPTKNLGAVGDAGAFATDEEALAQRVRCLRDYGQRAKYDHAEIGLNSRLDELQAALLKTKLRYLSGWNARRGEIVEQYRAGLAVTPLVLPGSTAESFPAWHLFAVRTPERDALARHLANSSIATAIHYPRLIPDQSCYARAGSHRVVGDLAVARAAARETLSLPLYPELTDAEVSWVIQGVRSFHDRPATSE